MKSKTEEKLDKEFKRIGVKPWIYHFTDVISFSAITVAAKDNNLSWNDIEKEIYQHNKSIFEHQHNHASRMVYELYCTGYGAAVCNKQDQFNRKIGRTIAKGRLLKHIKEIE